MSAEPFDVDRVIARLKDQVPALRLVEGAAEYATLTGLKDFGTPCAYVLLVRERGDGKPGRPGRQRALVTFGVVLAVKNYRGRRGAEAAEDLSPILGAVRNAIIGWNPGNQGGRECTWIQGDVLDYDAGTLLWSEVYQTQGFIGPG